MPQPRRICSLLTFLLTTQLCAVPGRAQQAADKLMDVESIQVKGTRLPAQSIIRLTGIKPHDKVNNLIVNTACQKITATGLVKNVDYGYDAYSDRPGVVLVLTITDEAPLLPATIKPDADSEKLWSALKARDPIFTRDIPPTEQALDFYAGNIEKCLQSLGRNNEYAKADVVADPSGKLTAIVFSIRQYKALARPNSATR